MYYDKLCDLGIKLTRRSGSEKCYCPICHDGRKNKRDRSLSVNVTTGEYKCHNTGCNFKGNVRSFERKRPNLAYQKPPQHLLKSINLQQSAEKWFSNRSISRETLDKFMIFCKTEWMPQTQKEEGCICFPYLRNGEMVNIKFRTRDKGFKMVKEAELIFYNLNSIGENKKVIITEGEIDTLSCFEAGYGKEYEKIPKLIDEKTGEVLESEEHPQSGYVAISVPNGASVGNQKLDYLDNCAEWLMGVEDFIIATDDDEAGRKLKDELIRRLGVERCRIVSYPIEEYVPIDNNLKRRCKDLNEVLMYCGKDVLISCIENASPIPVEGVYYVDDIFPSMIENFRKGITLAPETHFGEMDKYFRWKKGEVNLFVGWANHGKSFFVLQLMLTKSIFDGWKWAVFSPENYPAVDFYDDLIEMYVGKWLDKMSEDEYTQAAKFIDEHIFYVYPEDSHDVHAINEKFRYLVLKKGVDGVLIDPFNQLDHIQKPYQREDQYLSEVLKDIKRFSLLNYVSYNIIAHPVKQQRDADKSYPPVDMYDVAGGAMWANKSDNIISYYRPNHHVNKVSPEVKVFIQKIKRKRTGGEPGDFDIKMNWAIKRFVDPITEIPFCSVLENKKRQTNFIPQEMYLPYKDDSGLDIDF